MTKNRRGFTLIELILASAMMVLILAGAYSMFHTGKLSWDSISTRQQTALEWRAVVERMDKDVRNCVGFSGNDTRFFGTGTGFSFFTVVDSYSSGAILTDLALVSYRFQGNSLMRACLKGPAAMVNVTDADYEEFSRGASGFSFSYGKYNDSREDWDWKDTWEDAARAPSCVAVKASFSGKETASFERIIFLPTGGAS